MSGPLLSWSAALRHGWRQTWSGVTAALLLWLSLFVLNGVELLGLGAVGLSILSDEPSALGPGVLAAALLGLAAFLVRGLARAGAVEWNARRVEGVPVGFGQALLTASGTALSFLGWDFAVRALLGLWTLLALLLSQGAYLGALGFLRHGFLASAAVALAAVVSSALSVCLFFITDLALVRAVVRRQGVALSLIEAARSFWARPWAMVLIALVTAVGSGLTLVVATSAARGQPLGGPEDVWLILSVGVLLTVAFSTLIEALAGLTRIQAYAALELNQLGKLLPPPPPVEARPIARAELVVEALPVTLE
jgi:hypothetical protein